MARIWPQIKGKLPTTSPYCPTMAPYQHQSGTIMQVVKGATMPTMTRTAEVKTRTTAQIKADAAAVYARWGISLSDAINIFLAKSIEVGGLPFDMRPKTPTFDGLERYAYRPTMDSNGVAQQV